MAKRKKTALEIRISNASQNACLGLSINIMKLSDIDDAARAAAAAGEDIEAAARKKALELHEAK